MAPLPFSTTAQITKQGGETVGSPFGCSPAWPGGSASGRGGVVYDHTAQIELAARAPLDHANRKVIIDGVTYSVASAQPHEFLPHVELRLLRVKGG